MCTFYPAPLNGFEIESQFGIDENCELNLPPLNSVAGHATIKSGNSFPLNGGCSEGRDAFRFFFKLCRDANDIRLD